MKNRIPVGILGATGMVGQRMVSLLDRHPWFELATACASQRSAGRSLREAAEWRLDGEIPDSAGRLPVRGCDPAELPAGVRLVFSALDAQVAGPIEQAFRAAGFAVVTNASPWRTDPAVPLVIPEVNPDHLALVGRQGPGFIVANPNCAAVPLAMVLAPLHRRWGVEAATVSTWQAVSGAGYPGESAWDMVGSVHPHSNLSEEAKVASEPKKILGSIDEPAPIAVSARCVRVPAADGHMVGANIRLCGDPPPDEVAACLREWSGEAPDLPSCPRPPLRLSDRVDRPNLRLDAGAGGGMAVTVGRVERCAVMGVKLYALAHNTIRGAAGAAIANAELLVATGRVGAR